MDYCTQTSDKHCGASNRRDTFERFAVHTGFQLLCILIESRPIVRTIDPRFAIRPVGLLVHRPVARLDLRLALVVLVVAFGGAVFIHVPIFPDCVRIAASWPLAGSAGFPCTVPTGAC